MSKQTINLGTNPTGAGGDTPRSAFTKAQANFDELYSSLSLKADQTALTTGLAAKADQSTLQASGLGYQTTITAADPNQKPCGTMTSSTRSDWLGTTPDAGGGSLPAHFNVLTMGTDTRKSIIIMQAYNVTAVWPRMWIRSKHDSSFSPECEVYTTRNTTRAADGTLKGI